MYKAYDSNPVPDDELVGALNGLGAALVGTVMVLQPLVEKTNEPYELIEETTEIVLQATGDESVAEDVTSGESAKEEGTSDGGCEQEADENEESPHKIGEKGTQTTSTTTGKNGSTERVDVENPSPGQRPGNIHYHDPNNTKWYYEIGLNVLVDQLTKELAPPKVQKIVNSEWFKKAVKKALKILGETLK